jgi:hypothetical protein
MTLIHTIKNYFPRAFWQAQGNVKRKIRAGMKRNCLENKNNQTQKRSRAMTC